MQRKRHIEKRQTSGHVGKEQAKSASQRERRGVASNAGLVPRESRRVFFSTIFRSGDGFRPAAEFVFEVVLLPPGVCASFLAVPLEFGVPLEE